MSTITPAINKQWVEIAPYLTISIDLEDQCLQIWKTTDAKEWKDQLIWISL